MTDLFSLELTALIGKVLIIKNSNHLDSTGLHIKHDRGVGTDLAKKTKNKPQRAYRSSGAAYLHRAAAVFRIRAQSEGGRRMLRPLLALLRMTRVAE